MISARRAQHFLVYSIGANVQDIPAGTLQAFDLGLLKLVPFIFRFVDDILDFLGMGRLMRLIRKLKTGLLAG
jgi:hypothetical protein